MSVHVGAQLDNYRVIEKIGEGGMGAVYRAVDVMLERDVALKFLRPELAREPDLVERFRAEAVVLARLNHQYIASVFGLHRFGDDWFMAMEFVPGETLNDRLKRIERFPPDAAVRLTSMVLHALEYAHRLGVVHRDIKTANVILTPAGTVKVMDFGIARVLGSQRLTRAGSIVGTLGYMAPEQIQGQDVDQRADLYSTGIMLYEMLAGRVPFEADTDWALMQAQIGQPPRPLHDWIEAPAALELLVMRALEKAPDRRFQTATDFLAALESFARGEGYDEPRSAIPGTVWDRRLDSQAPTRVTALQASPGDGVTRMSGPPPAALSTRPSGAVAHVPARTPPPPPVASDAGGPAVASPAPSSPVDATRIAATPPDQAGPATAPPPVVAMPPGPSKPAPAKARAVKKGAPSKGRGKWFALAGGLAVVIVAVAGWYAMQRAQPFPPPEAGETPSALAQGGPEVPVAEPGGQATNAATPDPALESPSSSPTPPPPAGAAAPAAGTGPGQSRPGAQTGSSPGERSAARRPAPGSATRGAPSAQVASGAGSTPVPATPEPPPASVDPPVPPAAVPADVVFKGARVVREAGPEIEVELHFEPTRLSIRNIGGRHELDSMNYAAIAAAEYHESRSRRVFVRTTRHWLVLRGAGAEARRLRLERENYKDVLAAVEQRTGRPVKVTSPEQDERD